MASSFISQMASSYISQMASSFISSSISAQVCSHSISASCAGCAKAVWMIDEKHPHHCLFRALCRDHAVRCRADEMWSELGLWFFGIE